MRKLLVLLIGMTSFFACQNSGKQEIKSDEVVVIAVDEMQKLGAELVGKKVTVTGTVTHVCKQTGERCYLMGSTEDASIRVEAGKSIGSFTQELMGSDLTVNGVVAEFLVDEDYLNKMEALAMAGEESNEDHIFGHGGSGNHDAETGLVDANRLNQIAEMRQQLQDSGNPYLTIYYVNGDTFEENQQ